jgi:phosphocarrier protein HPr
MPAKRGANTSPSPVRSWMPDERYGDTAQTAAAPAQPVTIRNKRGLHARASAKFVQLAESFDAEITVTKGEQSVGGTSIMGLMMLAAAPGCEITVDATRPAGQMRRWTRSAPWSMTGSAKIRPPGPSQSPSQSPSARFRREHMGGDGQIFGRRADRFEQRDLVIKPSSGAFAAAEIEQVASHIVSAEPTLGDGDGQIARLASKHPRACRRTPAPW